MNIRRRAMLAAAGTGLLAGAARSQPTAPAVEPSAEDGLVAAALANRHRLNLAGGRFSGPAWELLVREGGAAEFFLIGEEHGIAENPRLTAALFRALIPSGFRRLGIEISPPMAAELDRAAGRGLGPLRRVLTADDSRVAFFGMAEEAEMLAEIRAALPREAAVFWGLDYEIGADRRLIALLEATPKPPAAERAVAALRTASTASWAAYARTGNPTDMYSFGGDPALVRAARSAWPSPDPSSRWVLDVLEETLEINRLFFQRQGWESNRRRAAFMRANFLRHWRSERAAGSAPKAMFKMGSSHLVRGRSNSEVFDLGALLPEVAAIEGARAFSMMVLPGPASSTAVLDVRKWTYAAAAPKDGYAKGLEPLMRAVWPDAFTLIDLRPLRPLLSSARTRTADPELMRVVQGYDAILVMSGSTPSTNLKAG